MRILVGQSQANGVTGAGWRISFGRPRPRPPAHEAAFMTICAEPRRATSYCRMRRDKWDVSVSPKTVR